MEETKQNTQWHSVISSGIQIELQEYAANLEFEEEHKLGTGSKSIDLLIRKKQGIVVQKNIGRIFRGHNLFEVKGLTDYISIDSFYRACGYGLFYKANTPLENIIDIEDITFSFVAKRMPRKLIKHLEQFWGLYCTEYAEGIYYLEEARIPIQLIITSKLSTQDNLWLQSLLNPVQSREVANRLLLDYEQHKGNCNYEDVMQQIVKQNTVIFKEEDKMCQALDELIEEGIQERFVARWEQEKARRVAALEKEYKATMEKKYKAAMEKKYKAAVEKKYKAAVEKECRAALEKEYKATMEKKYKAALEKEYKATIEKECRAALEKEYNMRLEAEVKARLEAMGLAPA